MIWLAKASECRCGVVDKFVDGMADFIITPALVKPSASATIKQGKAGATIVAGNPIYLDTSDKTFKPADANSTEDRALVKGIALTGSSSGQPILYATKDSDLDLGVAIDSGQVVVLSATEGGIAPNEDAESGWNKVVLGVGTGGTKINLLPIQGGAV